MRAPRHTREEVRGDGRHGGRGPVRPPARALSPEQSSGPRTPLSDPTTLSYVQSTAGNSVAVQMLRGDGRNSAEEPAVQRVPTETAAAPEPRSVFHFDSDSETESETETATATKPDADALTPEQEARLPYHKSLRALRTVIRKGMIAPEAQDKKWTVKAKIDPGAPWTSSEFRDEGEVGHVWLEVTSPLGESTEFGFYPQTPSPFLSVPGVIICPDGHGGDKEQKTASVGLEQVLQGYQAAFARKDAKYNLTLYNCASFASDVWEAMTGRPLPKGLLISNPAAASDSIKSERDLRAAYGDKRNDDTEDLIEMLTSGHIPPAM
ncbi:hypothetical protein ACIBJC_17925 [Streptomyces sp. NPDC050509]|uniref:hypothetical protein n=1 Tax=Streptomyces sp. NPDC050509 TaxID=3365620 RepID=UPI0037AF2DBC